MKEVVKKSVKSFEIILNTLTSIIIKIITTIKDTAHWYFTLAAIPKVISANALLIRVHLHGSKPYYRHSADHP